MNKYLWAAICTVCITGAACKKNVVNNLTDEESRIYITNYDTTAQFGSYKTVSVSDSVAIIQNNQLTGRDLSDFDAQVISAVRSNLQKAGYTIVSNSEHPDLAVNISSIINTYTGYVSYPVYWDDYYSYWDPYFYGYPGYGYYAPYAVGSYSIQSGGLNIDMLDLKNATANGNKIKSIWTGLARGEGVFNAANAANEVNALFSQSTYLKTNQ